ncbi:hypothetical protein ACQB60_07420 [Actinomycetota bacterium Odt1-20B]
MDEKPHTTRTHMAEVLEVWPRDGQILLRLELVGAEAAQSTLVLRQRDDATEVLLAAEGSGHDFAVHVPLEALTASSATRDWVWDLYLAAPCAAEPLRVGRHLDDITGKKNIFVYPTQHAAGACIQPYFTVKDNLSIRCARESA